MAAVMTREAVQQSCVDNGGYRTPCLNDKLYLHYKGYTKIENLDAFTGARCVWLEANGISVIEGLEPCKDNLRQLFLQQNCIKEINGGLENLTHLVGLNLSENFIKKVDGLGKLSNLGTLQLAQNVIETFEDLVGLRECPSISCLELNKNRIEDPRIIDVLATMPHLKVLKLDGNPITRKVPHYRKAVICRLKNLAYLDDRPVFPDERLLAEAWGRGGLEAEKIERTRQRKHREWTDLNRHKQFFAYVEKARKKKGLETEDSAASPSKQADSKPREQIPRPQYDVHTSRMDVDKPTGERWALPRRAECVIEEAATQNPPRSSQREAREKKRASREARLKKAMQLVEEEQQQTAQPDTAQASTTAVEVQEPQTDETKEADISTDPNFLLEKSTLKDAASQHCKGEPKWQAELDEFGAEMTATQVAPKQLVGAEMVEDGTDLVDLDELD